MGIPLLLKHYVPPYYKNIEIDKETNALFPERLDGFVKVGSLGGGSESVYEIRHKESGKRFVIKLGAHEESGKFEILCNALYRKMGVAVPKMRVYKTLPKDLAKSLGLKSPYGIFKVTEYIEPSKGNTKELKIQEAIKHYVAHALLGNIDVAKEDNFIADQEGNVYLIDAGANFKYRSLGKKREEEPKVANEIDTLKDASHNKSGSKWFAGVNQQQIAGQVVEIAQKSKELSEVIWAVSNELELSDQSRESFIDEFSQRLDGLVHRFPPAIYQKTNPDKAVKPGVTSAGVFNI